MHLLRYDHGAYDGHADQNATTENWSRTDMVSMLRAQRRLQGCLALRTGCGLLKGVVIESCG